MKLRSYFTPTSTNSYVFLLTLPKFQLKEKKSSVQNYPVLSKTLTSLVERVQNKKKKKKKVGVYVGEHVLGETNLSKPHRFFNLSTFSSPAIACLSKGIDLFHKFSSVR